jgi:PAS domain S-box-containing protein
VNEDARLFGLGSRPRLLRRMSRAAIHPSEAVHLLADQPTLQKNETERLEPPWWKPPKFWLLGCFVAANILAAGLGQGLSLIPGVAITFWPPSGLFVTALLVTSRRTWPWWTGGALAAELTANLLWFHNPLHLALIYFAANAAEALVAAVLVKWAVAGSSPVVRPRQLESPRNGAVFALFAGGIAPIVGATIIATTDVLIGKHEFSTAWWLVWLGDGTGLLFSAPLALAAIHAWQHRDRISAWRSFELAATCGLIGLLAWLALHDQLLTVYVALPAIVWAAVRFQLVGVAVALGVVVVTIAIFTREGRGEFAGTHEVMTHRLGALQAFLGVSALTALLVAGLSSRHVAALARLRMANQSLERRVQLRTAALKESERRLRSMADTAPALLWVTDELHNCTFLNRAWQEFTGRTQEEGLGMGWIEPVHPDDRSRTTEAFLAAASRLEAFNLYYRLRRADGVYRWAIDAGRPRFNAEGQFAGYIGSVIDIDERMVAEEAFRRAGASFQQLVEQSPFGVYAVDADFQLAMVSAGAQKCFQNVRPLLGRDFAEVLRILWPEPFADEAIEHFRRTLRTGESYHSTSTVERRADSGETEAYDWKIERVILPDGRPGVVCHFYDLSERQRYEAALRESEQRYRTLVDATSAVTWACPADGLHVLPQSSWLAFAGKEADEMLGDGWMRALHPDDVATTATLWKDAVAKGAPLSMEHRVRRHDGEWRWMRVSAAPVRDSSGQVVEWFGMCLDITDQKQAEMVLRDADRRKNEFLATLAHELRNPLAPLRSGLEVLRLSAHEPEIVAEMQRTMERQLTHLVALVDDLLDVSRVSQGKLTLRSAHVQLTEILRDTWELCQPVIEQAGHQLHVEQAADPVTVFGDPHRLVQVLSNLINNAARYTPQGGNIWVTTARHDAQVMISVKDDGIGIADHQLQNVFEMFAQVAKSDSAGHVGLGIGLSLVKSLVEMHGGSIDAASEGEGKGSTFVVQLPIAEVTCETSPRPPDTNAPPTSNTPCRNILVVDDNQAALKMLSLILNKLGHEVRTADNGELAIATAREFLPDLIIMDIDMPVMDGNAAAKAIRAEPWGDTVTLVALTGWGQDEDVKESEDAGFDHHLVKPVEIASLQHLISNL